MPLDGCFAVLIVGIVQYLVHFVHFTEGRGPVCLVGTLVKREAPSRGEITVLWQQRAMHVHPVNAVDNERYSDLSAFAPEIAYTRSGSSPNSRHYEL